LKQHVVRLSIPKDYLTIGIVEELALCSDTMRVAAFLVFGCPLVQLVSGDESVSSIESITTSWDLAYSNNTVTGISSEEHDRPFNQANSRMYSNDAGNDIRGWVVGGKVGM
jgi:hypothetical protein